MSYLSPIPLPPPSVSSGGPTSPLSHSSPPSPRLDRLSAGSVSAGGPPARGAALAAPGGAAGLHQSSPVGESALAPGYFGSLDCDADPKQCGPGGGWGDALGPATAEGWGVATGGRGRGGPGLLLLQSVEGGRGARSSESRIRTFYVQAAFAQGAHISLGREDSGVTFPEL